MRTLYREKIYECGNYREVHILPVHEKQTSRGRKRKSTSEVMKRYNQRSRENHLTRIMNANFTERDMMLTLTYHPDNVPQSDEDAIRQLRNFLRRLKNFRKKLELPELKYVAVTEKGKRTGRYHHHITINGGLEVADVAKIWGRGYVQGLPLQFNETGLSGLANYLQKEPVGGRNHWTASRNLIIPQPRTRDGRLSKRKVLELAKDTENRSEYEKLYEGYYLAEAKKLYNDINGGIYIHAIFYKKEVKFHWQNCNTRQPKVQNRRR